MTDLRRQIIDCPSSLPIVVSLSDPLPVDFVLDKRLIIRWFPRLRFCGRCRNLEFMVTVTVDVSDSFCGN